jgi:hypothetical protein
MMKSGKSLHIDKAAVVRDTVDYYATVLDRAVATRSRVSASRFFDVYYQDLVQDPIGTVRRIHAHFGYELSRSMENRMQRWLRDNPQHKHGVHSYSLDEYGLSREELDAKFGGYLRKHFPDQTLASPRHRDVADRD